MDIKEKDTVQSLKDYFDKYSDSMQGRDKLINKLSKVEANKDSDPAGWHSTIAELEAFYLLQNKLGLPVCEYEPELGNGKKPDFLIKLDDTNVTFEVKDKCGEEVQQMPKELTDLFEIIERDFCNKYVITVGGVVNNDFKMLKGVSILRLIENEIRTDLKHRESGLFINPHPVSINENNKTIASIAISERENSTEKRPEYFQRSSTEDIKNWLFERGKICSKNGKRLLPMVEQAESQNADYLMCRIPAWRDIGETLIDYIKPIFSTIKLIADNLAESSDLGEKLSGAILFDEGGAVKRNEFIIINNMNIEPKIRTEWFKKRISN